VPRPRLAMRKVRDILRLAWGQGLSHRVVGAALGIPFTTVADHLRRAKAVGLSWPLPEDLSDAAFGGAAVRQGAGAADPGASDAGLAVHPQRAAPPWGDAHVVVA
jgi:hypothetical protein